MTKADPYIDPSEQKERLKAIITRHSDSGGAIPAAAVSALANDLDELLDATRSSGNADGYEEAVNQE